MGVVCEVNLFRVLRGYFGYKVAFIHIYFVKV